MKNKKGFTLIELLAVIVVLAVIMVIATQQVNGVMAKARSNSFIESYQMVVKQGKSCAAQDDNPSYREAATGVTAITSQCNYDLSKDYKLVVLCGDNMGSTEVNAIKTATVKSSINAADYCHVTLTATTEDGSKFKNMDLLTYGNGAASSGADCAKKIGSGAIKCTDDGDNKGKEIQGYFEM